MNDSVLSEHLRALRVPPPGAEFERLLEQALWREAQALRAERGPLRSGGAARARRWGGRTGLTMALVLGATAAAAAAGGSVWVWVASGEHASPPAPAAPTVPRPERPAAASPHAERAAPERVEGPVPIEAAELVPPAAPVPEVDVSKSAVPKVTSLQLDAPHDASRSARATHGVEAPRAPERSSPLQVQPLELPSRELSGAASGGNAAAGSSALPLPERSGGAAAGDRRGLPELRSRAERRRNQAERPDRDRAAQPPGLEIARERSGRDNAERGLERAREAHERK
jgi:hypothetical protein